MDFRNDFTPQMTMNEVNMWIENSDVKQEDSLKSLKFMNSRIRPDMMEYFAFKYPKIEKAEIDSTSYGRSRDDNIYAMRKTPICECTFNTQSVDQLMESIADIRDYSINIKGMGNGWKTIYIKTSTSFN